MKLKDLVNVKSTKYYYNGMHVTCIIKADIIIPAFNWQVLRALEKHFNVLTSGPNSVGITVKGVATCLPDDEFNSKKGETIARTKAKAKLFRWGKSIWHLISELYEDQIRQAYDIEDEFEKLQAKEVYFYIDNK